MTAWARADSSVRSTPAENAHLPELVRSYLERSLPPDARVPAAVRVQQTGEMRKKPGARAMPFRATEDFAVDRVAFSWRARFPILGPLALAVLDEFSNGDGQLRVSLLGVPLQTEKGPETAVGEAMRYLAELPWAPQAIVANRELEWQGIDNESIEVACRVGATRVAVRWHFNEDGDVAGATGMRPFLVGKTFVPRRWGGEFGEYATVHGIRAPISGQVWWDLPEGRFVYWRGRLTGLELIVNQE